jgi:hypothetical protein
MKISEKLIRRLIRESLHGKRVKTLNESIVDDFVAKAKEIGGDIAKNAVELGKKFLKFYSMTPAGLIFSSLTGCTSAGCIGASCHWVWWYDDNGLMSTCKYNLYAVSAEHQEQVKNFYIVHWPEESFGELTSGDSIFCEKDFSKEFKTSEWSEIFEMLQKRKKNANLLQYTLDEATNSELDKGGVCWAIDMHSMAISDARIPETPGITIGIGLEDFITELNTRRNFKIIEGPVLVETSGGVGG